MSTQWKESADPDYDWGALRTYHSFVGNPGSFNMSSIDDSSSNISALISGYPRYAPYSTSVEDVYYQYEARGVVNILNDYILRYRINAMGGQSGAPILDENNTVIGIHTRGNDNYNYGVRITPNVLYYINEFIAQYD